MKIAIPSTNPDGLESEISMHFGRAPYYTFVEVEKLVKYYGKFLVVDHISFEVKREEFFGFGDPNGAGKTTTKRILTGILKPSGGEVRIFGKNAEKSMLRIKQNIGVFPEMANPYIDLTPR